MSAGEVVVAVSGIAVSGLLGPWITTTVVRTNERRAFQRTRERDQRNELRQLLDEAAVVLSKGPRLLRRKAEQPIDAGAAQDASDWSDTVFPMRERLVLRLPTTSPVVAAYDAARESAQQLAADPTNEPVIASYEKARDGFLEAARTALLAPIQERQK